MKAKVMITTVKLSLCVIAKNEEKFIERCLASVSGVADELVVVDTGSTDATVAIAKARGAKVYSLAWREDFSEARNFALKKATGDWVLQLDADEELHPPDSDLLQELIKRNDVDAYACQIVNLTRPDTFDGAIIQRYYRLFRRRFFHYVGSIHEQVVPVAPLTHGAGFSNIHIVHWGYLDPKSQAAKGRRNLALLSEAIQLTPNDPYLHFYIGQEEYKTGRLDRAVIALEKAEALRPPGNHGFLALVLVQKCDCLRKLKRLDEAMENLAGACEYFFDYRDLQYIAGQVCVDLGNWEEALAYFRCCERLPEPSADYSVAIVGLENLTRKAIDVCTEQLGQSAEGDSSV